MVVYVVFERSSRGQLFDEATVMGPNRHDLVSLGFGGPPFRKTEWLLSSVKSEFLAVAACVFLAIGIRGRKTRLTVVFALATGASMILARVVKTSLPLKTFRSGNGTVWQAYNTLPSGHSTAAFAVAIAGVAVTAAVLRGWATWLVVVLGTAYAVCIGTGTIILGWHRPSDVIAANFLVGCIAFLALAVAVPRKWKQFDRPELVCLGCSAFVALGACAYLANVLRDIQAYYFNVSLDDGFPVFTNVPFSAKNGFVVFVSVMFATSQFLLTLMAVLSSSPLKERFKGFVDERA